MSFFIRLYLCKSTRYSICLFKWVILYNWLKNYRILLGLLIFFASTVKNYFMQNLYMVCSVFCKICFKVLHFFSKSRIFYILKIFLNILIRGIITQLNTNVIMYPILICYSYISFEDFFFQIDGNEYLSCCLSSKYPFYLNLRCKM